MKECVYMKKGYCLLKILIVVLILMNICFLFGCDGKDETGENETSTVSSLAGTSWKEVPEPILKNEIIFSEDMNTISTLSKRPLYMKIDGKYRKVEAISAGPKYYYSNAEVTIELKEEQLIIIETKDNDITSYTFERIKENNN